MITEIFFSEMCERVLRLCRLRSDEVMVVVDEPTSEPEYADAFMAAAVRLGAKTFRVSVPRTGVDATGAPLGFPGEGLVRTGTGRTVLGTNAPAVDALRGADLIIDRVGMLFSGEQHELLLAGKRILTCNNPVDQLLALFPTVELRERTEAARHRLATATTLRFTNDAGTDVTYQLGQWDADCQYGYTDTPGRWDNWPSGGFVYTGGADDGVDGRVVVAPGDLLFPHKRYVTEPITFEIDAGRIVEVSGSVDAVLTREFMESFEDERGYGISHIGWGLDPRANISSWALDPRGVGMGPRGCYGNVMFSTGPNTELRFRGQDAWGTNDSACHLDIPMFGCTLTLDDEPVVVRGKLVEDLPGVRASV
jgi:2,5-dihydroxypyridine 5,6-dioxygenase